MSENRKDQRRSRRFPCSIPVTVWVGKSRLDCTTRDASRHGMFLKTPRGPKERFLVKLEIQLPEGPIEATAFVTRRVADGPQAGVGVQFFALSTEAKARWDGFVTSLSGNPQAWTPTKTPTLPADSATFLIKLRDLDRLGDFFERNICAGRVFMNTPVLREVGAPVGLIMIHPDSEREFLVTGTVARVSQAPKGMELTLDPVTPKLERRFREFVETGRPSESMDLLLHPDRPAADVDPVAADSSDGGRTEPLPPMDPQSMAFEVDSQTGDLTLDIEIDEASVDDLQVFETPLPEVSASPAAPAAPGVVAVRCTGCGTFLGPVDTSPLPDAVEWVAERRTLFDRFHGVFEHRVDPKPAEELEREAGRRSGEVVPVEALFELARLWGQHEPDNPRGPNFEPQLRLAAQKIRRGENRVRLDLACPICSEKQLFASVE